MGNILSTVMEFCFQFLNVYTSTNILYTEFIFPLSLTLAFTARYKIPFLSIFQTSIPLALMVFVSQVFAPFVWFGPREM